MSNRNIIKALLFLFVFFVSGRSYAQNATVSPYSRYGLGDLAPRAFVRQLGMGGVQICFDPVYTINSENPAALANLSLTTYEGGVHFIQYDLRSGSSRQRTNTAALGYFDFGFPLKQGKWGLAFGLSPYSNVGYSLKESSKNIFGDDEIRTYNGSGGINSFHLATGFKLGRHLSFGAQTEYLFGTINKDRTVEFESTTYLLSSVKESAVIGWFHFNTGLQLSFDSLRLAKSDSIRLMDKEYSFLNDSLEKYINGGGKDYELKNALRQKIAEVKLIRSNVVFRKTKSDWRLIGGLTFSPEADLRSRNNFLNTSFKYSLGSTITVTRDTIDNYAGNRTFVRIPVSIGGGLGMRKGSRWYFGTDVKYTQWSSFVFMGQQGELVNSTRASAGIQLTPNDRSLKSYHKIIQYRLGFYYENGYLKLNGVQLADMGITAGLTLPIKRTGTQLHFSAMAGKRGTTSDNLIEEKYLRISFGFTINDRWFLKPKYD